jgi:hypothetical protein
MLTPPLRLPASAWAVIERAITDAETAFVEATTAPTAITDGADKLAFIHHGDKTDKAAIQYVVSVFDVAIETLISAARDLAWTGEELRVEVDTLLDQLIDDRAGLLSTNSASDFRARASRAVRARPSWLARQDAIRTASAATAEASAVAPVEAVEPTVPEPVETTETPTSEPATLEPVEMEPAAEPVPSVEPSAGSVSDLDARRIKISAQLSKLKDECHWNLDDLAHEVGIERNHVSRHLRGTVTPRLRNLRRYEEVFSARLKRDVKIDL